MAHLTNDPHAVRSVTGFDPFEHSLPQRLSIDGYRSAMPLMAVMDDGPPLVFLKEIDRSNVEKLKNQEARFVWYAPYFSFGGLREPSDAYPDLVSAVRGELSGVPSVDSGMTIELLWELGQTIAEAPEIGLRFQPPRHHYVIKRTDVPAAFDRGRQEIRDAAAPLIADLGSDRFGPWLAREPEDGFARLDGLMEEAGIDALLVASPLSIQDLTGIPMRTIGEEVWAVWLRGSDCIHVLSHQELALGELPQSRKASVDSVRELTGGSRLGVEDVALSFQAALSFDVLSVSEPATGLLRRWRELRSWEDLSAYVIGARVTLEGIQDALSMVEQRFAEGAPVTEMDAYERYRSKTASFIRERGLPIRIRTYFTHSHAGDRSHFPASAIDHPIPRESSLKIDGGLELYDSRGMFLGVSDITRSAVGTPEAREFYDLLDRALVEGALAACRPGVKGSDVFAAGMAYLEPHRQAIVEGGFMPASDAPMGDLFRRNIGHLIGKQEPATVEFRAADDGSLEAGMVAAAEFQWPYAGYCIGTEDVFLVTEDGPLNLTRPA